MDKELIQCIFDKIAADLPQFKTVGLYNNNFNRYDSGEGLTIAFPAIYISFPEAYGYTSEGRGNQKVNNAVVRFLIADKYVTESSILNIFDLKQEVFKSFQSWHQFNRFSEQTDEDRTGYYVFEQDYAFVFTDTDNNDDNKTTDHTVGGLTINDDLIIDPNTVEGIRTDKEI